MKIKDNLANIVSITRIFVAYIAIALLFEKTTWAYLLAFILTAIAFAMDGLDGYIARKLNQSSKWGSVLDIMGDRIVEASYSMQSTSWGKFICASRFMRISYAVAKVLAFMLLIVVFTPGMEVWSGTPILHMITMIFAWIAIIFCVVRAIPVVAESGKLFN